MDWPELLERVAPLRKELPPAERADAERVLELVKQPGPDDRRELGQLVERLARRAAKAVPFAVLGRARLAELADGPRAEGEAAARTLRLDCALRLDQIGY